MQVQRRKPLTANVAVFSVGLDTYWKQFDGLLEQMHRKTQVLLEKLENHQVNVTDFGMIDNAHRAYEAVPAIKAADPDILFIDMVTYAASITFAPIIREMDCPVVLLALQPLTAMDYVNATTYMQLCNDDVCSVPEFTGVAVRMGKPVADVIIGMLENDAAADSRIAEWCRIAHVRHDLRRARIGLMGHVLDTMLDMQTDPASVTAAFGAHAVPCEPDEIMKEYAPLEDDDPAVKDMASRILEFFDTPDPGADMITEKL
ncbi:MAG: arabinose isomerase, partial [Lentisphaeria bacterium]|nr:arabinose isomerase [Lentisphaeria bacterium]